MKTLSEIGRYVEFEGKGSDWSDVCDDTSISHKPVIVMTLEERRELIKESIGRFIMQHFTKDVGEGAYSELCMNRFLEDEGLV